MANERQIEGFIDKLDRKGGALIRSARKALRKRLPTANELVIRKAKTAPQEPEQG